MKITKNLAPIAAIGLVSLVSNAGLLINNPEKYSEKNFHNLVEFSGIHNILYYSNNKKNQSSDPNEVYVKITGGATSGKNELFYSPLTSNNTGGFFSGSGNYESNITYQNNNKIIPEPASLSLMGLGLGMFFYKRKK
ncbi:MAG: PEP-CTERM sorting domain-containing protein [Candidatus Nanoarchaeia archaeon]